MLYTDKYKCLSLNNCLVLPFFPVYDAVHEATTGKKMSWPSKNMTT